MLGLLVHGQLDVGRLAPLVLALAVHAGDLLRCDRLVLAVLLPQHEGRAAAAQLVDALLGEVRQEGVEGLRIRREAVDHGERHRLELDPRRALGVGLERPRRRQELGGVDLDVGDDAGQVALASALERDQGEVPAQPASRVSVRREEDEHRIRRHQHATAHDQWAHHGQSRLGVPGLRGGQRRDGGHERGPGHRAGSRLPPEGGHGGLGGLLGLGLHRGELPHLRDGAVVVIVVALVVVVPLGLAVVVVHPIAHG